MNSDVWNKLKQHGSDHYKTGETEPIDLYVSGKMFHDFAIASIIKYAFRSRRAEPLEGAKFLQNMDKIVDYARKLKAFYGGNV
jgi:hypothetical protein